MPEVFQFLKEIMEDQVLEEMDNLTMAVVAVEQVL
jgi:predicted DNA-binding protein